MGKIECRLFLTAWSRRDRVRFCDNEKGGHWLYDDDGNATVRVIYAYCVMFCFGLFLMPFDNGGEGLIWNMEHCR